MTTDRKRAFRRGALWTAAAQLVAIVLITAFSSDGLMPPLMGAVIVTAVVQWLPALAILVWLGMRRAWWVMAGMLVSVVGFTCVGVLFMLAVPNV